MLIALDFTNSFPPVLRSRNYLFLAPAPSIYWYFHFKMYYKKYVSMEVEISFSSSNSILPTDCRKYLLKRLFRLRLRLQISTGSGSATLVFRNHLVFGQVPEVTGYFLAEISLWLLFFGLGCF